MDELNNNNKNDEKNILNGLNQEKNDKMNKIVIIVAIIVIAILVLITIILIIGYANRKKQEMNQTIDINKISVNKGMDDNTISNGVMTKSNEEVIDDENAKFDRSYGKIDVVWVDTNNNIIAKPLEPSLGNLTPVKYNSTTYTFSKININNNSDGNWYDYDINRWANAVDDNGNYFVWIPRYAYKITYYSDSTYSKKIGYSDSRGILKINDDWTLSRIYKNNPGLVEVGNHYIVHPSFTKDVASGFRNGGWDSDISGFWVAKFETSLESSGSNVETSSDSIGNVITSDLIKLVSKPAVSSWRNISVGNAYYNSYNFNREMESHLIKNSEWGAISYLSYSKYGLVNNNLISNSSSSYITGNFRTEQGVFYYSTNESSTFNETGVYDLSGGAWEFVASLINNGYSKLNLYGGTGSNFLFENANCTKYKTVYSNVQSDDGNGKYSETFANLNYNLNSSVRGDAIFETSNSGYGNSSFNNNSSYFMQQDTPFLLRGGYYNNAVTAGLFSFASSSGQPNEAESYRVILMND